VQLEKVWFPIAVTELGISMEVKLVHPENALPKIVVIESENWTDFNPVQSEKAYTPIFSTESGSFTDVNPVQPEKAP